MADIADINKEIKALERQHQEHELARSNAVISQDYNEVSRIAEEQSKVREQIDSKKNELERIKQASPRGKLEQSRESAGKLEEFRGLRRERAAGVLSHLGLFGAVLVILFLAWFIDPQGRVAIPVGIFLITVLAFLAVRHRKHTLESEHKFSKWYTFLYWVLLALLILEIYFVVNSWFLTFYDRPLFGQLGETGISASEQIAGLRAESGVAGPLNVLTAILLGEFDPDAQKWDSRQVRESYVVPEDFGVVFDDIAPSRSAFYYPDEIELRGDVTVVSLFEEGEFVSKETPLEIGVEVARCEKGFADILEILPGIQDTELWCEGSWNCDIPGETKEGNKFSISKAYNRFFVCEHEGLDVDAPLDLRANVFWKYTTQAVSGRQIFVAHPDTLARIENPRAHYNIPKASLEPWSINDGTVDFGVGFDRDVEFLRAEGPADDSDRFTRYFLGVSLENEGSGKISKINNLEIFIPADENIVVLDNDKNPLRKEKGKISGDFVYDRTDAAADIDLDVYKLRRTPLELEDDPILPGFFETFYLEMSINTDYLQNTAYQSFFVRATTSYDYKQDRGTTIRVEPEPF